jgi:hypothetical protein
MYSTFNLTSSPGMGLTTPHSHLNSSHLLRSFVNIALTLQSRWCTFYLKKIALKITYKKKTPKEIANHSPHFTMTWNELAIIYPNTVFYWLLTNPIPLILKYAKGVPICLNFLLNHGSLEGALSIFWGSRDYPTIPKSYAMATYPSPAPMVRGCPVSSLCKT